MTDVITNLCNRRAKAFKARRAYAEEAKQKLAELDAARQAYADESKAKLDGYDAELDACARAMSQLNAMAQNCLCPACHGEGVVKTGDGPDGPVVETCGTCMGTGIKLG